MHLASFICHSADYLPFYHYQLEQPHTCSPQTAAHSMTGSQPSSQQLHAAATIVLAKGLELLQEQCAGETGSLTAEADCAFFESL